MLYCRYFVRSGFLPPAPNRVSSPAIPGRMWGFCSVFADPFIGAIAPGERECGVCSGSSQLMFSLWWWGRSLVLWGIVAPNLSRATGALLLVENLRVSCVTALRAVRGPDCPEAGLRYDFPFKVIFLQPGISPETHFF